MSSTPNVTISLNPAGATASQTGDKAKDRGGLEPKSNTNSFAKLVDQARDTEATDSGNGLPKEEGVSEPKSPVMPKTIDVNLKELVVRREGRLKLITGEIPISEESLVGFMREQGFSRSEMAEVLMARQDPNTQIGGEQPLLTGNWLQIQATNQSSVHTNADGMNTQELNSPLKTDPAINPAFVHAETDLLDVQELNLPLKTGEPLNLAEALAAQLITPQAAKTTSPIVDLIVTRDVLATMVRASDDGKAEGSTGTGVKTLDLSTLLARAEGAQSGPGGQGAGQDAHGAFERGERVLTEAQSGTQKPQEFREFLAEHLRRADSLRELSDRLGTMLARQINAHIARGTWRLEMALHPAELGSIEVDMEMTERGLEASFRATQSVTRDLLMDSMARLKSWFEEGGIDVAYAGLTQDSGAETGGNSTSDESSEQVEGSDTVEVSDSESSGGAVIDPHRLDIRV